MMAGFVLFDSCYADSVQKLSGCSEYDIISGKATSPHSQWPASFYCTVRRASTHPTAKLLWKFDELYNKTKPAIGEVKRWFSGYIVLQIDENRN